MTLSTLGSTSSSSLSCCRENWTPLLKSDDQPHWSRASKSHDGSGSVIAGTHTGLEPFQARPSQNADAPPRST